MTFNQRSRREWRRLLAAAIVVSAPVASAQQPFEEYDSRADEIQAERREKRARLWPETQSPIAEMAIDAVERGLIDGFVNGKGSNGWQVVLGGMRSGQGFTLGAGYRRSDLWHDRVGFRVTGRGTLEGAMLFDGELDFPQLRSENSFLHIYAKYENSPQMDFYGLGPNSDEDDRSSYRLEDTAVDAEGGFELFKNFTLGATGGLYRVHTGAGQRDGFPSTDEEFPPIATPGLDDDTYFLRWGIVSSYDYRDNRRGASSGGVYGFRYRKYSDRDLDKYNFSQFEGELQQFIPYFNKTRVIALRLMSVLSTGEDRDRVPIYLQPVLGGNDYLRGFARQRFYANNAILFSAEHRWYAFDGLEPAIFFDAGKVERLRRDINFKDLEWSAGIGLRVRVKDAVVMRIDFAVSREGARFMWTFNDIFRI